MNRKVSFFLIVLLALPFVAGVAQAKTTKIVMLHYLGNAQSAAVWDQILEKYTKLHPNVAFDSQNVLQTQYFTQLRTRIAAQDPPDIMMGQPAQYPDIIDSGYVMDISNNPLLKKIRLLEGDLLDASYKGKVYAFPLDFKVSGVMYNKDIFKKYGIVEPKTFQELMQLSKKLKDNGVDPWVRGYNYNVYPDIEVRSILWPLLIQNGKFDAFEKLMTGKAKFRDYPEFAKAVELWTQRMAAFPRLDDMSNDYTKCRQIFASGGAAMIYEGTYGVGQILQFNPNLNLGIFAMPRDDGKPNKYPYQLDKLFMVNGKSKNLDEVLKFMEFLFTPEIAGFWSANAISPSVVYGVKAKMPESIQTVMAAKDDDMIAPASLFSAYLYGEFATAWRAQLQGYAAEKTYNTSACLDKLQAAFDKIIKSKQE